MVILKNNFTKGLDWDSSYYTLPHNSYVESLNITRDATTGNQDEVITNIVGNQAITFALPTGTNKTIGAYENALRNTVIEFVYNSLGYHSIIEYNNTTRTRTKIFTSLVDSATDILNFTLNEKITSINIYPRDTEGDLLFFIDSLGRPTTLNILDFKAGRYTPATRDIIDVGRRPPLSPPTSVYGNDTSRRSNNHRDRLYRFKYRYQYNDFEKSTSSPISTVPLPVSILDEAFTNVITNNNLITVGLNSGAKNVKKIELLMSFVNKTNNWSDFVLVESFEKTKIALTYDVIQYPPSTGMQYLTITFAGNVIAGAVINVYLTTLPSTQVLIGTYTAGTGDTLANVLTTLAASISASPLVIFTVVTGNSITIEINSNTQSFNSVTIANPNVINNDLYFSYNFYNESTYPYIDINESILLYDFTPELANAQELVNGNVLTYGGITEGYDNTVVPNVVNSVALISSNSSSSGGNLSVVKSADSFNNNTNRWEVKFDFSGFPAVGTVVKLHVRRIDGYEYGTPPNIEADIYTTGSGDTAATVGTAIRTGLLVTGINATSPFSNDSVTFSIKVLGGPGSGDSYMPRPSTSSYADIEIIPPSTSLAPNSIATWKWSTERTIGIAYFDSKGKTNGVVYSGKVSFPVYQETVFIPMLPYINTKIYHVPPVWAYSYTLLINKNADFYLFWISLDVKVENTDNIYFDVTNFVSNAAKNPSTAKVLSYTYQEGDRVRLIRRMGTNDVYDDTYDAPILGLLVDPKIIGVPQKGTFLKIKYTAPISSLSFATAGSNGFVLEIYRPKQQTANKENQVFYEIGRQYAILNPGTSTRVHAGQYTSQDPTYTVPAEINIYKGDTYFRQRRIISDTGTAIINVMDKNFLDFYPSEVSSIDGRPNIIDTNARRTYFAASGRFGQAYQFGTNINGLNRFYPNNTFDCDLGFGDIQRLKVRDRHMRVFQKFKIGQIPLEHEILKQQNGNLVVTDKLLNPVLYYVGDYGIGTAKESLASLRFADYFCDNIHGVVCRISNDGVSPLSLLYKTNSFATSRIPLRVGNSKIYGAIEAKSNNYIFAMEAAGGDPAITMCFDETTNSFESPLSYLPEMMVSLGTLLITFKNGILYAHDSATYNNFYGVQYDSTITLVFNDFAEAKKTFVALTENSNAIWDCPQISTDLDSYAGTKQASNLVAADFLQQEQEYNAALLRDANSLGGLIDGDDLKGKYIKIKFRAASAASLVILNSLKLRYLNSPLN